MAHVPNRKDEDVHMRQHESAQNLTECETSPAQNQDPHQAPALVPPLAAFHPFGPTPLFLPYLGNFTTTATTTPTTLPHFAAHERLVSMNRLQLHGISDEATNLGKAKHNEDYQQVRIELNVNEKSDKESHKKRSKNWTRPETLTLIRLRTELEPWFSRVGRKTELWEQIALGLRRDKFRRDGQQCRDKWEKLMAGYKEVRDGVKEKEDNPYYEILHPLMVSRKASRLGQVKLDIDVNETVKFSACNKKITSSTCTMKDIEKEGSIPVASNGHSDDDYIDGSGGALHKRKRSQRCVTVSDLRAIRTMFESLISRQQKLVGEFLETLEQKERQREQVRQEREMEWRAEEQIQSQVLNNAMLLLTQKLVGEKIRSGSLGTKNINNPSTHQGTVPKF